MPQPPFLPGDPARVDHIAGYLTDVRREGFNREYKSVTGMYKGRRILAISTGMGGPSAAICVEELADLGVRDMIRIGSCGALQKDLSLGQLVLCDRAVCDDGTSQTYRNYLRYADEELDRKMGTGLPADAKGEPAICWAWGDPKLLEACQKAAKGQGFSCVTGSTRCHDALYQREKPKLDEFYSARGVLGFGYGDGGPFCGRRLQRRADGQHSERGGGVEERPEGGHLLLQRRRGFGRHGRGA